MLAAEVPPILVTFLLLVVVFVMERARRHRAEIDKMKNEFVSLASHQLRTPLTGIKWFTDLLLREKAGKLTKDQKEFLTQIADSNARLIALVEDLLNVSRIETGRKFNIELKPTDVVPMIDSLLTEMIGFAGSHQITVKKSEAFPASRILNIDEQKMRQVFANLLSNAIKYSKKDGVVEIGMETAKDGTTTLFVKDAGLGIPKAQ